jgi:hypothetical protein
MIIATYLARFALVDIGNPRDLGPTGTRRGGDIVASQISSSVFVIHGHVSWWMEKWRSGGEVGWCVLLGGVGIGMREVY